MGSKVSAIFFVLTSLIASAPAVFAFEDKDTEYRQTVLKLENLSNLDLTATIRKEIKHNDHTARVLLDSKQKSLLIIHHKSIGIKEMASIVANLGIPTKAVDRHNYQPAQKPILSNSINYSIQPINTCGATKTAWKRLFLKYFH